MSKPNCELMSKPVLISLFCGAGGMDLGFHQAGFDIAFAADYFEAAIKTHKLNFDSRAAVNLDLSKTTPEEFIRIFKEKCPGVIPIGIIGGPPCQGFSLANTKRSAADPRNNLAMNYAKLVNALFDEFSIKFFLFENVPGILSPQNDSFLSEIKNNLAVNFDLKSTRLDAADFGVPQHRVRFLMAGVSKKYKNNFDFPLGTSPHIPIKDIIATLPEPKYFSRGLSTNEINFHPNHWTMRPKSLRFTSGDFVAKSRSFVVLDWEKPSRTVAYGHREIHVHPNKKRRLSIYEAMLLQGFPHSYQLVGTLSEQVTQISNAVPPPVAFALANKFNDLLKL